MLFSAHDAVASPPAFIPANGLCAASQPDQIARRCLQQISVLKFLECKIFWSRCFVDRKLKKFFMISCCACGLAQTGVETGWVGCRGSWQVRHPQRRRWSAVWVGHPTFNWPTRLCSQPQPTSTMSQLSLRLCARVEGIAVPTNVSKEADKAVIRVPPKQAAASAEHQRNPSRTGQAKLSQIDFNAFFHVILAAASRARHRARRCPRFR